MDKGQNDSRITIKILCVKVDFEEIFKRVSQAEWRNCSVSFSEQAASQLRGSK